MVSLAKLKSKTARTVTLASALILSACTGAEPAIVFLGATTDIVMTDKLPTDYIAEALTDKDCSYIRHLDDGGPLCRSEDYGKVVERPLYCYRTLGRVNCYERPDPYNMGQTPVQ